MDATKKAINKLTSGDGHHTTEVHEHYKPAVTHEEINPRRENVETTVIDNEVHQEHYHTSVLPIEERKVLPTEHAHKVAATKHQEHRHGNHEGLRSKVAAEAQQFKDQSQTTATENIHTVAPTVVGEHRHHHVHETIQPVIHRQTVQPSVIHTTIPLHEVHHNEPKYYTASVLPAVTMEEFKAQGGSVSGLTEQVTKFEDEPEKMGSKGLSGFAGHASASKDATVTGTKSNTSNNATVSGKAGKATSGSMEGKSNTTDASATMATGKMTNGTMTNGMMTNGTVTAGAGKELSRAQKAIDSRVDRATHGTVDMKTGNGTVGTGAMKTGTNDSNMSSTSSRSSTDSKKHHSLLHKLNPFKDTDSVSNKGVAV